VGQVLDLSQAEGRVTRRGVYHSIRPGATLRRIARAYGVSQRSLLRANRLRNPNLIRSGSEIFVPEATRVVPILSRYEPPCLNDSIEFFRVRTGETRHIVITQCNGRVWEEGRKDVSHFLDRTADQSAPLLHPQLLRKIQLIADRFSGRRLEIVSAYRPPANERQTGSRHAQAKAVDFRVDGVTNERLRDAARRLGNVGVGYYPNSTFVHLDVRETPGFWVDWSRPGEAPRYAPLNRNRRRARNQITPRPRRSAQRSRPAAEAASRLNESRAKPGSTSSAPGSAAAAE
jgi:uncharacterized protein YcbK (DUF882 family)